MKERKKLRDIHPSHVIFDTLNTIFMILLSIVCIYPLWYIFIYSISDPLEAAKGLTLLPRSVTLTNFAMILRESKIFHALGVSFARTILGTAITVVCT